MHPNHWINMAWKSRIYMAVMDRKRGCKDFKKGIISNLDRSRETHKET